MSIPESISDYATVKYFSRWAMEFVLWGLQLSLLLIQYTLLCIYLDDVIVTGKSFEDHITKRMASKWQFFQTKVLILGHQVSGEGVQKIPALVEDMKSPEHKKLNELQVVLGVSYYRYSHQFIYSYAEIHRLAKMSHFFQVTQWQHCVCASLRVPDPQSLT